MNEYVSKFRHKRDHHSVTVKRATNPLAIGAQRPNASVIKANQSDSSRITSIKVGIFFLLYFLIYFRFIL